MNLINKFSKKVSFTKLALTILSLSLLSLSLLTTQIKATFIRGAIYENEKTGQKIILLGDLHFKSTDLTEKQRQELIWGLKNLPKDQSITLVEDSNSNKVRINDQKYQSTIKFLLKDSPNRYHVNIKNESPLIKLHEDLIENKINTENIECRYYFLNVFAKYNPFYSENITPKDLLNEFKNNKQNLKNQLENLSKYKKNYLEPDYTYIKEFFESAIKLTKEECVEFEESMEKLEKYIYSNSKEDPKRSLLNNFLENQLKNARDKHIENMLNFINANLLNSIINNYDKKIIVICSGLVHCSFLECFLPEIGYKQIFESGTAKIGIHESAKFNNLTNNPPKPIDVTKVFEKILPKNTALSMLKLFNTTNNTINETSHIIIDSLKKQYFNNFNDNNKYIKTNNNFKKINFETLYDDEPTKIFTTKAYVDKEICSRELDDLTVCKIRWLFEQNKILKK